jgi:hypothetical protein
MDQDVVLFLETAGPTVVAAMATDAYQQAKDAVVSVWRRLIPFGADGVEAHLEEAHTAVVAAREQGDEVTEQNLGVLWQRHLQTLFTADPGAAVELRAALIEAGAVVPAAPAGVESHHGDRHLEAKATGNATVYQAGNNQHITTYTAPTSAS